MNIELVKHDSPESIVTAFANPEGNADFDLSELGVGGIDANGDDFECSAFDMISGIRASGYWGFAATKDGKIHVWDDGTASIEKLMYFLGHEVGHMIEENLVKDHPDPDEARADLYGEAASEAYKLLLQLRQ